MNERDELLDRGEKRMANRAKQKGANGEREAGVLITGWLMPVYELAAEEFPQLRRNLEQWRSGGYDLIGIDWLALEIKRQELEYLAGWWRQTVESAGPGQTPFLLWRKNRSPWRARTVVSTIHGGGHEAYVTRVVADLSAEGAAEWLRAEAWARLRAAAWG